MLPPFLRARLAPPAHALATYPNASAAVAVVLREGDETEVLLTERTRRDSDPWSGQWSFPGGRRKPDEPLDETVIRETQEEVGLRLSRSWLVGCIEPRSPGNVPGMLVIPFVFEWSGAGEARPSPEVASLEWIPLSQLPPARTKARIRIRDFDREVPAFVIGPMTIWGFTYRVLEDLLQLLQ